MNMNPAKPQLTPDDFDRALLADRDNILPSSGFADAVMAAVRHEASAPAPIAFPWKRALPGLAVAVAVIALLIAALVVSISTTAHPASAPSFHLQPLLAPVLQHSAAIVWVSASLVMSLASVLLTRRLISAS